MTLLFAGPDGDRKAACVVQSWQAADVGHALEAITSHMETHGLTELVKLAGNLTIHFDVERKRVREAVFFSSLVKNDMTSVVPILRRLIETYLTAVADGGYQLFDGHPHPWFDGDAGIAAFAHPMRALLLLDPRHSHDLFIKYLDVLDDEHASETWRMIFDPFVRTHGLKTVADVRLAINVVLHDLNAADGEGMWQAYTLVRSAKRLMTGTQFAALVKREIEVREKSFAPDQSPEGRDAYFQSQVRHAHDLSSGPLRMIFELRHDVPASDAFGKQLHAELNEHWQLSEYAAHREADEQDLREGMESLARGDILAGLRKVFNRPPYTDQNQSAAERKMLDDELKKIAREARTEFGKRKPKEE